jgi:predicted outer membrane repeat protein
MTLLEERAVPSASILYVDASNAATQRNGSNWAHAYNNLQSALTQAATLSGPTQIWIAEGTYTPTQIYSPNGVSGGAAALANTPGLTVANLKTFNLPNNVSLYGGFLPGMNSLAQRNPAAYPTILSGDLAGNDGSTPPGTATTPPANKTDNAWHVVTAGNDIAQTGVTALLDGLQIVDGYADGPNNGGTLSPFVWGHSDGGGVYSAWGSSVTLNNDVFLNNFAASDGGGAFSNTSNITATNCTFLNNSALVRAGGLEGLNDFENGISHTSTLVNDNFQGNTCAVFGGAVVGEGAYQGSNSTMSIVGSTFAHNQAAEGGAIVIDTLTVSVDSSTFLNNVASVDAGALATTNVVGTIVGAPNNFATTITNSSFVGNVCQADPGAHAVLNTFVGSPGLNFAYGGGALVAYMNGYLNVDSDSFIGNETLNGEGGAILNGDASANLFGISAFVVQTKVTRSTFIGNVAVNGNGGAIASESDHLSPVTSTIPPNTLIVSGSTFLGNFAADDGGAIYIESTTATIGPSDVYLLDFATDGDNVFKKN